MPKEIFKGYDISAKRNVMQILKMTNMEEKGKCLCKSTELDFLKTGIFNIYIRLY